MNKKSVVLYPGLGVGHLTPMIELAKLFTQHGVAVTVALVEPPAKSPDFSTAVARAAASNPRVTFHVLPPPDPADSSSDGGTPSHHVDQMFSYLKAMNAPLRDLLRSLPAVDALVVDMFCRDALGVAAELNLPVYYFYASGASALAVFLNLPRMTTTGFLQAAAGDSVLSLPGAPPFRASELPELIRNGSATGETIFRMLHAIPEANGILVNTFESLEPRAVRALRDGLCVPDRSTPPVYCIGPLVSGGGGDKEEHECLRWLDMQPDQSVVFLSFGSLGRFPKKQLEEMAIGLEKSGQRFLWVVRSPANNGEDVLGQPLPEPDLEALLPEGFLERTRDRGLVLKSWAPQVDVLGHRATGAFVTHCGWNSTLEGIMAGLPLLCWPLYAEQRMNKVFIVEEMKLGVEMNGYDEGMVKAEEVETKVKWVMESQGGRALRDRMVEVKDRAVKALKEGGSSHDAFVEFLK
ncbi:anthocyanidin 5,3-O-glucosyltransferase [Sorghum bicolor]|jgi:hypothetical protein|uniref:Glycosyltransferase n=1 Tax=Sorghum bicolor TaxID=4558 RepID=C5XJ44_SORBI|nr:anthocyanidin 5,3-O-glucosyltransferase [Sorghum bicolor]EES01428.1 hypothetical protein SORBI_3003G287500 [Sorghum bicolor]|eukprot:XP_002456308.1 anthocyanidin 5,3-O-glucosyltransferase [Sorghum bicolor]